MDIIIMLAIAPTVFLIKHINIISFHIICSFVIFTMIPDSKTAMLINLILLVQSKVKFNVEYLNRFSTFVIGFLVMGVMFTIMKDIAIKIEETKFLIIFTILTILLLKKETNARDKTY